ncbi:MAG: hypothetical protein PVG07_13070 [Acidobacteriota bacterium]
MRDVVDREPGTPATGCFDPYHTRISSSHTPFPYDEWLEPQAFTDFCFQVRISPAPGELTFRGTEVPGCQDDTVCGSGALAERPEVYLRILGPRPNGFLWPTIIRFTPSRVEVWIEQQSTRQINYYDLPAVGPGQPAWPLLPGLACMLGCGREDSAPMPSTSTALLAAPPLTDFNPASHGVWFGAFALAVVIVIIVLVDVVDWLWQRLRYRRGGPGWPEGPEPGQEERGVHGRGVEVHRPDSELRHRHYREPPKISRDHRPNEPADHARVGRRGMTQ